MFVLCFLGLRFFVGITARNGETIDECDRAGIASILQSRHVGAALLSRRAQVRSVRPPFRQRCHTRDRCGCSRTVGMAEAKATANIDDIPVRTPLIHTCSLLVHGATETY